MNSISKSWPLAILVFLSQSVVAEVAIDEITVTADFRVTDIVHATSRFVVSVNWSSIRVRRIPRLAF